MDVANINKIKKIKRLDAVGLRCIATDTKDVEGTIVEKEVAILSLGIDEESKCIASDDVERDVAFSPLKIDLILSKVQSSLKLEDLANCRLVSHHWHRIATAIFKRRHPLIDFHVRKDDEVDGNRYGRHKKLKNEKDSAIFRLKQFCHLMKTSWDLPYTAFKLNNINMFSLSVRVLIKEFIKTCGASIKTLVLDVDWGDELYRGTSDLQTLLRNLACSLEILDLDGELFNTDEDIPENWLDMYPFSDTLPPLKLKKITFPVDRSRSKGSKYWEIIFRAAHQLQEINTNYKLQTTPLLKALSDSERLPNLVKLRLEYMNEEHLDLLLATDNLSLTEFRFNILSNVGTTKKFELLLHKLSPKLLVLAMGSPSHNSKMIIKFPKMPKLKRLGLFHCDDALFLLNGLRFSVDTPSLQSLEVSSGLKNIDWQEYLSFDANVNASPCTTVTELSIGLFVCDPQCVQYMQRIFPNVKKLSLEFPRREFLLAIWRAWQDLEELNLYFHVNHSDCKDQLVCGIPLEWKKKIMKKHKTREIDWWKSVEVPQMNNSICNFTKLKSLTIEESPKSACKSDLSDFAAFFGFSKLKNLRTLKIGRSQMTAIAINFLRESLPQITELDIRNKNGPGVFSPEEEQELLSYIKYYERFGDYERE